MKQTKTALYRHFGENDVLLYVGISLSATTRLAQHSKNAPWYEDIKRITIEYLDTRELAIIAEKKAIIFERPLFNQEYYKHKYRIPNNIPYEKFAKIMEEEGGENYYLAFRSQPELEIFMEGYKQFLRKRKKQEVRRAYINRLKTKINYQRLMPCA